MSGLNNFKADVSSANYVIEKFYENPGKFASIVLQMYWDMKAERDTLIDDIAVLKAENEELKNIEKLLNKSRYKQSKTIEQLKQENEKLEREKKDLHLQMNSYFDERLEAIEKYFTLTDHIRLKAENNPGVSRYIDLVNYIDRLERADDEKI